MLPPPPVKRPLQARFFDTVPLESCTVPQLPLPTPVVKLSSLGFGLKPQQPARVVVVVIGVVVVVTIVVVVAMGRGDPSLPTDRLHQALLHPVPQPVGFAHWIVLTMLRSTRSFRGDALITY